MLQVFNNLAALFQVSTVPPMIMMPPRHTAPTLPSPNPETSNSDMPSSPSSSPIRVETVSRAVLSGEPLNAVTQESPSEIRYIALFSSTFTPPPSRRNHPRIIQINLDQLRQLQSSQQGTSDPTLNAIRGLLPLIHMIQAHRKPPHLLRTKEIKEFAEQYLEHMIDAKNDLIKTKAYTEEECPTSLCSVLACSFEPRATRRA